MAKRSPQKNGLEEAMRHLILSQAEMMQTQASCLAQITTLNARIDERLAHIDEKFERIDKRFERLAEELHQIKIILVRHEEILQTLPEAVRQKIGFGSRRSGAS